jgi:hypothetical protein
MKSFISYPAGQVHSLIKLLGIISVGFEVTDQQLELQEERSSAFHRHQGSL